MEKTYALIRNGVVYNIIVWDGVSPYDHGAQEAIQLDDSVIHVGFLYQDGQFIDPNPPKIDEPV
jgi:hypothetical protein